MFHRRIISKKNGDGENPFLLTFSDFMASLLAIFILVLIVTLIELNRKQAALDDQKAKITAENNALISEIQKSVEEIDRLQDSIKTAIMDVSRRENLLTTMLVGIQKDLELQDIEVVVDKTGTIHVPEKQLGFPTGQYQIPSDKRDNALKVGQALLKALQDPANSALLDTVFIEGHTDSTDNRNEMGNWRLSTDRAAWLWLFWTNKPGSLAALKTLRTQTGKSLIGVSGYADTRSTHQPVDATKLPDDRPEDRRIDIRFTLVSSEKQSLEGLKDKVRQVSDKTKALKGKLEK